MDAEIGQQAAKIARPADCDGRGGDAIFQHQIPADEPAEKAAHGGVGIGVGAAGDRDHRGHFGVAQPREEAADPGDDERDDDGRAGMLGGRRAGDDEDARADDGADAQPDQ